MKNAMKVLGLLVATVGLMTGCGSNNSNANPSVVGPYGYAGCTSCVAGGNVIASGSGSNSIVGESMMLQFVGATAANPYTGYTNSGYQQVYIQGVLNIGSQAMECNVPPGAYQIVNVPAVMSGTMVQAQSTVMATGPTQVQIQFSKISVYGSQIQVQGQFYAPGAQMPCAFSYQ